MKPRQGGTHENKTECSAKDWSETTREAVTKSEFYQIAGITPELEEFVGDFIKRPEILNSLSQEKQQEIEAKMDAVFAMLC